MRTRTHTYIHTNFEGETIERERAREYNQLLVIINISVYICFLIELVSARMRVICLFFLLLRARSG